MLTTILLILIGYCLGRVIKNIWFSNPPYGDVDKDIYGD